MLRVFPHRIAVFVWLSILHSSLLVFSLRLTHLGLILDVLVLTPSTMLAIKVEHRPTPSSIASRFIAVTKAKEYPNWIKLWDEFIKSDILSEEQRNKCGSVIKIEVSAGELKGHEIAGSDPVTDIIDMGVKSIVFLVRQPTIPQEEPARRSISTVLIRQPSRSIPDWKDDGHPVYTNIYMALKNQLIADGVKGFTNPDYGIKFLRDIVKLLFSLSTFWDNLENRGHPLPLYFEFSKNAMKFNQQKKKKPKLTQELVGEAINMATRLSLSTLLDVPPTSKWNNLKIALQAITKSLEQVKSSMVVRASAQMTRVNETGSGFFGGSFDADRSSVVYKDPAQYLELRYQPLEETVMVHTNPQ